MIKGRKDSQFGGSFKSIGMIRNSSIKYDRVLQPLLKMLPQLDSYVRSYFSIHEVDFFYYNTLIFTTFRPIVEEKRRIIRARK